MCGELFVCVCVQVCVHACVKGLKAEKCRPQKYSLQHLYSATMTNNSEKRPRQWHSTAVACCLPPSMVDIPCCTFDYDH